MHTNPSQSVERYIRSIARHYINAVIVMTLLIGAGYATVKVAIDRHALQQNISFATSSQFIHFQQLANQTRALMRASADPKMPDLVVKPMIQDIKKNIAEVRRLAKRLDELNRRLSANALEKLISRDESYEMSRRELTKRLSDFLRRAERVINVSNEDRRRRYSFWGPIDFAVASDSGLIQQFGNLIASAHNRSGVSIRSAAFIYTALAIMMEATLVLASLFLFSPLLRKLREEHTQSKAYEAQLAAQAHTDNLTGLQNRTGFTLALEEFFREANENGSQFALFLLDLDRFKEINDSYGHPAGDAVLSHVGDAIRSAIRSGDVAARLGGDEFAVLISDTGNPDMLRNIAKRIQEAVRDELIYETRALRVSASIGGAIAPIHGADSQELIRIADSALYSAKGRGDDVVIFDEADLAERQQQNQIVAALIKAPERDEFVVHYQPKVDLETLDPLGFEALVRWQHPEMGLLPPGRFLPFIEGTNAMRHLTKAVIQSASRDIRVWKDKGLLAGPVAINLPEVLLVGSDGTNIFNEAIREHGLDWTDFTVEVTENVFFSRASDHIYNVAKRFRECGTQVSLDDFGTGFASLVHLRDFPFDELKIDRSFVFGIGEDLRSEQIVRAMLDLARNLGKKCVAEGVETEEQRSFLLEAGCPVAQGYLFSKPLPVGEATRFLEKSSVAGGFRGRAETV